MLTTIKRLWKLWRIKPYIQIHKYAELTARPMVSVGLYSRNGAQGMFFFEDTTEGNARAELCARTAAHIVNLPIHDIR
jgi:hypothetical protein